MSTLITVLHVIVCLFLMLTVLLQSGKGGGMGAAFGGGNAATVFGGSGASNFLKRLTAVAGTIFMMTSMVLAYLASHNSADALEKFGMEQQQLAEDKEAARTKALETTPDPGAGAAVPGATTTTPDLTTPGATTPAMTEPATEPGAAIPPAPTAGVEPATPPSQPNPPTNKMETPAPSQQAPTSPPPSAPPVTRPLPSTTPGEIKDLTPPAQRVPAGNEAPPNTASPMSPAPR